MRLNATVDGTEKTLVLDSHAAPNSLLNFSVDDEAAQADVAPLGTGVYSIVVQGRSYEVRVEDIGNGCLCVDINGSSHRVEVRDPRRWIPGGGSKGVAGTQTIKAQMPGKIVKLLVQAGDEVEAGQGLIVVEAMKMQNEMKSPKAGRVVSVEAEAARSVEAGEVLMVIE